MNRFLYSNSDSFSGIRVLMYIRIGTAFAGGGGGGNSLLFK